MQSVALGSRGHGVVTGITEKAVFVSFFGKAKGMVPLVECPLPPGQSLAEAYTVGQGAWGVNGAAGEGEAEGQGRRVCQVRAGTAPAPCVVGA